MVQVCACQSGVREPVLDQAVILSFSSFILLHLNILFPSSTPSEPGGHISDSAKVSDPY